MKELFLAELRGYRYGFAFEAVRTVVAKPCTLERKAGRVWLPFSDDAEAELCPLDLLFSWPMPTGAVEDHFVALQHGERLLALPMHGAGCLCSVRADTMRPLPAAYSGFSRRMISGILVNGNEIIMQANMEELVRATDKIAYLRKKKLLAQRQAGQGRAQHEQ